MYLKDIVTIGYSMAIAHILILANSNTTLTTYVRGRADGDKVQNADGAERKKNIADLAAPIAAVKVAEGIAAMTATKARARVNVPKVPAGDNPLQVSRMRIHADFICRADVTGATIVIGIIQKHVKDGELAHVLSTGTLASICTKNAHRAKSHATRPLAPAVKAQSPRHGLHDPLRDPQEAKAHTSHLLDPEHRAVT